MLNSRILYRSLFLFIVASLLRPALPCLYASARGLPGNPPGLDCSVRELFGRWLRASGGESAWKALWDIQFDLVETRGAGSLIQSRITKKVAFKLQPVLRWRMERPDYETGKFRCIYAKDDKGWYLYRENVPIGTGDPDFRSPQVLDDPKTGEDVEYEFKAMAFWMAMPFNLLRPDVKLRFAGFLAASGPGAKPLPMLEADLSAIDWPIDLVIFAISQKDWLPVEARFRFVGDKEADWNCVMDKYTRSAGIVYPRRRLFFQDGALGEREELMCNVVVNRWLKTESFKRPSWLETAPSWPSWVQ